MAEAWKDSFRQYSIKVGFALSLTRPMCEFLSAVADDVSWDRATYGSSLAFPDNFLATSGALTKRGLIERKADDGEWQKRPAKTSYDIHSWSHWQLTPAGECVVALLKLTGMFVEADMATEKKARRGRGGA
jgi:hypothetical protein